MSEVALEEVTQVLEVLVPQARVDVEAELLLDGRDALGIAISGLRGPGDGARDRVPGYHPRKQETDGDRHPGSEEIDPQPAQEGAHR
jgi:hypothetical protein